MTYSIVGRDEASGELGVAVQSRAFGVGMCAWARPGVGAVATQSFTERGYGPRGLDLLAAGASPVDALAELLEADEQRDFRQVAFLAADGRTAAHTGAACIPDCGQTEPLSNSSSISSMICRRERRSRTVRAAIAASSFGPKQPRGTPAGSSARTVRPQSGQQTRCKRCSLISTASGGSSATWCRAGAPLGSRSSSAKTWPHPQRCGQ